MAAAMMPAMMPRRNAAPVRPPPGLEAPPGLSMPAWQASLEAAFQASSALPSQQCPARAGPMRAPPGLAPARQQCAPAKAIAPAKPIGEGVTTLVVQNLPGRYSQEDVLALWPIDGSYDYLHVPYNLLQKRALGYVFINFASPELARAFQRRWHGALLPRGSGKALEVAAAEVQGRRANLELIRGRKVGQLGKAGFLPVVLENGMRLDAKAILASTQGSQTAPAEHVQRSAPVKAEAGSESDTPTTACGGDACDNWDLSSTEGDSPASLEPMYVRLRV